jgi:hypothetical protein
MRSRHPAAFNNDRDIAPCWPPVHKRAMVIPLEVLEAIRHVASRTLHSSRVTALDAPKI